MMRCWSSGDSAVTAEDGLQATARRHCALPKQMWPLPTLEPHRSHCCTLFHPTLKRFLMGPSEASTLGCTAEPAWPLWYGASDASRWNGGTALRPPPPPQACCCCCCCCCCAGGGRPPDGCAAGAAERSRAVYSCAFGGDSASADPARLSSPLPVERTRQH